MTSWILQVCGGCCAESGQKFAKFGFAACNMQSLASTSSQLPIAEAWFKATAVGSAPQEQLALWQDPHGSMDQAPVSATGYSCQVCTHLCASKPHAIYNIVNISDWTMLLAMQRANEINSCVGPAGG